MDVISELSNDKRNLIGFEWYSWN